MATRKRSSGGAGAPTRLSVSLDAEIHRKLRCLALVRSVTIQALVEGWIIRETKGIRLPSETADLSSQSE